MPGPSSALYSRRAALQRAGKREFEDIMNLKNMLPLYGFALLLAAALPLRAQSGCVDSPEDPTILLALLGCAGAVGSAMWRNRRKK